MATTAATRGSAAAARIAPIAAHRVADRSPRRSPPAGRASAANAAAASSPNSPAVIGSVLGRVRAVAADVEGQAVEPGGVEELGVRQRPVAGRLPAVDEHDARARGAAASRDEPGRQRRRSAERTVDLLERQPEVGRA